jgi:hypothetical protein
MAHPRSRTPAAPGILCVGRHLTTKRNGTTGIDDDCALLFGEGFLAWRLHAGGPVQVPCKDIVFRDLRASQGFR